MYIHLCARSSFVIDNINIIICVEGAPICMRNWHHSLIEVDHVKYINRDGDGKKKHEENDLRWRYVGGSERSRERAVACRRRE
jgi:hypothetical protein